MTDGIDDGGPAFPLSVAVGPSGDVYNSYYAHGGMALRDFFAAQAIDRMISLSQDRDGGWSVENVAHGCYNLADAMLVARSRKQEV